MPRNYKMHVWEVQQAAQAILNFTDGKTLEDYVTDWALSSAVERQITKIGGAAARLVVNDHHAAQRIGASAGALGFGNQARPQFKRLDVFGSAVNGDFHHEESDVDFLVEFDDSVEGQQFETRFQLGEGLEALLGRSVDLVDDSAIQNPYFREEVDQTREPIYEY